MSITATAHSNCVSVTRVIVSSVTVTLFDVSMLVASSSAWKPWMLSRRTKKQSSSKAVPVSGHGATTDLTLGTDAHTKQHSSSSTIGLLRVALTEPSPSVTSNTTFKRGSPAPTEVINVVSPCVSITSPLLVVNSNSVPSSASIKTVYVIVAGHGNVVEAVAVALTSGLAINLIASKTPSPSVSTKKEFPVSVKLASISSSSLINPSKSCL